MFETGQVVQIKATEEIVRITDIDTLYQCAWFNYFLHGEGHCTGMAMFKEIRHVTPEQALFIMLEH